MSDLKTVVAEVASELETERPDLARKLQSALQRIGRPRLERDASGFTQHTRNKATLVLEYRARVANGEDEGEILEELATRAKITFDRVCSLISLSNDKDVRNYLAAKTYSPRRPKNSHA